MTMQKYKSTHAFIQLPKSAISQFPLPSLSHPSTLTIPFPLSSPSHSLYHHLIPSTVTIPFPLPSPSHPSTLTIPFLLPSPSHSLYPYHPIPSTFTIPLIRMHLLTNC